MKKGVSPETEEIREILASVGKNDKKELVGFFDGGDAVLTSGEAKGKHCFYGAAVAAIIDEEFASYLPYAGSLIVWIGSDGGSALRDLQWLFAALFRKTSGYCDTKVFITEDKRYENMTKVVIMAR